MEQRNEFEPSDLIYLFLDGEADGVQQTMLFGMLAASSELQSEFSEALQLRSAVEAERSETVPPPALTRELFEKAGFGVAPGAAATISTSAAIPAAILGLLRRFGVPLLCATAGALITALLFSIAYRDRYDRMERQIAQRSMERRNGASTQMPPMASATSGANAGEQGRIASPEAGTPTPSTEATPSSHGIAAPRSLRRSAEPNGTVASRDRATSVRRWAEADATPVEKADDAAEIASTTTRIIEPATVRSTPMTKPLEESGALPAMRGASFTPGSLFPEDEAPTGTEHSFSLQLRGMTDLRFFPSLATSKEAQPWFNNMSIGGLYHLSSDQALGIEVGQEYLPMYHAGVAAKEDHITWITGLYLLEGEPLALLGGLRPFVQGGVGASGSGPVGRGAIGLSYAPEGRVDLAIGAEGTAFLYHLDGAWYSARKAGLTYMMRVHF